jgi:hypothetical protein
MIMYPSFFSHPLWGGLNQPWVVKDRSVDEYVVTGVVDDNVTLGVVREEPSDT